jgi:hypothetical protein
VLDLDSVATDRIEVPALTSRQISAAYVLIAVILPPFAASGSLPQRTRDHRAVV